MYGNYVRKYFGGFVTTKYTFLHISTDVSCRKGSSMKVIALRGISNTGKTRTLKMLIQKLQDTGELVAAGLLRPITRGENIEDNREPAYYVENALNWNTDIYAIYNFGGTIIGISTQGDDGWFLDKAYESIAKELKNKNMKEKIDIFICAIRRYGSTEVVLKEITKENEAPIIVFDKLGVQNLNDDNDGIVKEQQAKINMLQSQILLKQLDCWGLNINIGEIEL